MFQDYADGWDDGYYGYPPRLIGNADYMEGYQDGEETYICYG